MSLLALALVASTSPASLDEAMAHYRAKDLNQAAHGFYSVLDQDPNPDHRDQAELYLAESLRQLDLLMPAVFYYTDILKAGRSNRYYLNALEGLLAAQRELRDPLWVPALINEHLDPEGFAQLGPDRIAQVNFLVGELSLRQRKTQDARAFLEYVPPESPYHPAAQYLLALVLLRSRDLDGATTAFRRTLDALGERNDSEAKRLRSLTRLALARVSYDTESFSAAAERFAQVSGDFSRRAAMERGWALLRQKDYPGTVAAARAGRDVNFGDAHVLEGTAFFVNCMWPAARRATQRFDEQYGTTIVALETYLARKPGRDSVFLHVVARGLGHYSTEVARAIHDVPRFQDYYGMATKLRIEQWQVETTKAWQGRFADDLKVIIVEHRTSTEQVAGAWVQTQLRQLLLSLQNTQKMARILSEEASKAEKLYRDRGVAVAEEDDIQRHCAEPDAKTSKTSTPSVQVLLRGNFQWETLATADWL